MRLLLALLVIFIGVISLGFWSNHSLQTSTDELLRDVEHIVMELEKDHWKKAYDKTVTLENNWNKKANWWAILLNHQEIDNIEFSLAKVKEYIAHKNMALSRAQLSELRLMIRHIPENETINIKNIL